MVSMPLLKLGGVALLALGAADLAWINLALGPRVLPVDASPEVRVAPDRVAVAVPPTPDRVEPKPEPTAVVPEPEPEPVAAVPARAGVVSIHFASMSGRIGSTSRAVLAAVVERSGPRDIIHLEGHTDNQGSDGYNEMLRKKRVDNAVGVLLTLGIERRRIRRSFVAKRADGEVPETERWRDRRVDVWIEGARP